MNLTPRVEAAIEAARTSGEMLLHCDKIEASVKGNNDFVTQMDLKSEQLIRGILLGKFPEDDFYGEEEGGALTSDGRWIVDPIDGTGSFMRRHIGYTVSIAYEYKGRLVIGVVYAPATDELFVGVDGQGATCNGKPLHVSEISDPKLAISHFGYSHRLPNDRGYMLRVVNRVCENISDLRRYGTAAYALACVAAGRSEAFFERYLNIYDVAAGMVLVREAGGRCSGWNADEDFMAHGHIVATNGKLHDTFLKLIASVGEESVDAHKH